MLIPLFVVTCSAQFLTAPKTTSSGGTVHNELGPANFHQENSGQVVAAHAVNPSTWEAETGRFQGVLGQPGLLHSETLS